MYDSAKNRWGQEANRVMSHSETTAKPLHGKPNDSQRIVYLLALLLDIVHLLNLL